MKLSQRPYPDLLAWAAVRIAELHGQSFPENATAMGVESEDGEILGVVAFHSWEPWNGTIEVSAVSEDARWLLARKAWAAMFDYAFIACDCQKIWSRTPLKNKRALRFVKALGFTIEAILPRQFGSDSAVISRRYREEYYSRSPRLAGGDLGDARNTYAELLGDNLSGDTLCAQTPNVAGHSGSHFRVQPIALNPLEGF